MAYEETSTYPEETVTAELQLGYKLQDVVLRPVLVKIARAPQNVGSVSDDTGATTESQAQSEIHSTTTTDQ